MSDDTRETRAVAVSSAIAITRMEGHEPSMFALKQLDRWIAGEITADQLRDLVRQHHGKPPLHDFVKSEDATSALAAGTAATNDCSTRSVMVPNPPRQALQL
ncbi:hypothetical protein ABIB75_001091 [Bradyrhizobium sp. GM2.2]|uniref:antitoxin VbhA family protein n=1 Tax=Bradyrhizobium sp. GM2.2 TaxID=3156358 RepID=UPI003393B435